MERKRELLKQIEDAIEILNTKSLVEIDRDLQ